MGTYSTKNISEKLLQEISETLHNLDYGSVEVYVQEGEVTQITRRHIRKVRDGRRK